MIKPSLISGSEAIASILKSTCCRFSEFAQTQRSGSNHKLRKDSRMSQQVQEKYEESQLYKIRHSAAHIMAQAVLEMFPEGKISIGPPIENGFYYDFDLPRNLTPEDLEQTEKRMRQIVQGKHEFTKKVVSAEEAREIFKDQPYKIELIDGLEKGGLDEYGNPLKEKPEISIYQPDTFVDFCRGPHVQSTKEIKQDAFKLMSIAGAYWRGDENNKMLQRIYGTAWENAQQLKDHLWQLEEAKKRDHRKLGKDLEIFIFDDEVGPGLPLWLPNGGIMIEELEKLAKEMEERTGYLRVRTPNLTKEDLFIRSGHLPYYAESMYPPMELEGVKYYVKPMNCPMHHKIFASKGRSYRDLPIRLAEYGTCYRYEKSGELFGLMRVRSLQMNDAHIYMTPEQFESEFNAVNEMYLNYFKLFGIEKYLMRFSTHDPAKLGQKFVDEPELWKRTEEMTRTVLKNSGINYVEVPNEAAFYGPKIDVQAWSVIGREFSIATNQVDFAQPRRFNLVYKDRDNTEKIPLCIHRAPLGTHERFIGFLIEHYAGNFPLWLSPEQVRILTIGDDAKLIDYSISILNELRAHQARAEIDKSTDQINGKIQRAEQMKVHTMFVIGKRDMEAGAVSVRVHGKGNLGAKPRGEVISELLQSIKERRP